MAAFMRWKAILRDAWGWRITGMEVEVESGDSIVCVPGCPVQPDNFMETLLYMLPYGDGARAHDSAG